MKLFLPLILLVFLCSCRTRSSAVSAATASRHTDSVAALRSFAASVTTREWVLERLVLRPDSLGRLVAVAHDIVKRTEKTTENETTGDTSTFVAKTETKSKSEDTKIIENGNEATGSKAGFALAVWLGTILLAVVGTLAILARWKNSRH